MGDAGACGVWQCLIGIVCAPTCLCGASADLYQPHFLLLTLSH